MPDLKDFQQQLTDCEGIDQLQDMGVELTKEEAEIGEKVELYTLEFVRRVPQGGLKLAAQSLHRSYGALAVKVSARRKYEELFAEYPRVPRTFYKILYENGVDDLNVARELLAEGEDDGKGADTVMTIRQFARIVREKMGKKVGDDQHPCPTCGKVHRREIKHNAIS